MKESDKIGSLNQDSFHGDFSLSDYQEWKFLYFTEPIPKDHKYYRTINIIDFVNDFFIRIYEKFLYKFNKNVFWNYVESLRICH